MKPGSKFGRALLAFLLTVSSVKAADADSGKIQFNRDIRPILSDLCFTCHGPEEKSRQGNLRLDSKESVFADRNGYRIIVPGSSNASRLYQKISSKEDAFRMPPAWSGRSLTPKQIELFRHHQFEPKRII